MKRLGTEDGRTCARVEFAWAASAKRIWRRMPGGRPARPGLRVNHRVGAGWNGVIERGVSLS